MKKFLLPISLAFFTLFFLFGCNTKVNFHDYVSENRANILEYSDDNVSIKIYVSDRETPFIADGIKGNVSPSTEIFISFSKTFEEVNVSAGSIMGEMSYRSVEKCYYLSASEKLAGDKVEVTVDADGEQNTYTAASVLYDGVISGNAALDCVIEHDEKLFSSLTQNNLFRGEIYIRLLYDEGCYYYVGVCDRSGKINAFLVDGEKGKIIAKKELQT